MPTDEPTEAERIAHALEGVNAGYVAEMQEQYLRDPASVDAEWRALFQPRIPPMPGGPTDEAPEESLPAESLPAEPAPAAAPAPATSEAAASTLPAGATPLKGPAARLAQNMIASLAVPTATSFRDLSVAILETRRRELNTQMAPRRVSFTHLIGWAIVQATVEQPEMIRYFAEADGQAYRVDPASVNLGLAVDVERSGGAHFLVVPVIRGADGMDFARFHAAYEDLVGKARANRLSPDDFVGATITLTNPGTLGTTSSVARLMPGQGTIVATGAIRTVADQRLMTLSSTYDHRIIQGAESGAFLRRIDQLLGGADDFYETLFASVGVGAPASAWDAAPVAAPTAPAAAPGPAGNGDDLRAVAAAVALVRAYRSFGHLQAHLDPLGSEPVGDPALDPEPLGLTPESMARIPSELLRVDVPGATLAEALPALRDTYCGSIAYEVEHIASHDERVWLRRVIESGAHRQPLSAEQQRSLLRRLTAVEGLERFLHKAYLGQKRFSIEGLDTMVPMLDGVMAGIAAAGAEDVVIGIAHRGRLNVLAHIVGVSYNALLSEFEAGRGGTDARAPRGALDDVKYHLGADGTYATQERELRVSLSPNPSHLEAVNPVVEGRARAEQTDRSGSVATTDPDRTVPVLIHGDAAFAAQGVVAETFNMARLAGYTTG
ncbi:MAG: 2-oxo acid dehydrogenase subunit E2, partial [Candidatus Limnocylindria bacterium]